MRGPSEQVMLKVLTNRRRGSPASPLTEVAVAAVCTKTRTSLASRAKSKGLTRRALRLLSIAAFLVIGLLALIGCSGGEEAKDEEETQVPRILEPVRKVTSGPTEGPKSGSKRQKRYSWCPNRSQKEAHKGILYFS